METPVKNRQKYRKNLQNNKKLKKTVKISKIRQKYRKTWKKPSKISKNRQKYRKSDKKPSKIS